MILGLLGWMAIAVTWPLALMSLMAPVSAAGPAGDPARAIGRDAASRDDDVGMRMVGECRPPGVEHGRQSDAGADVLGVGGDGDQGLGGGFEQQVIDDGLVLIGDVGDRPR